MFDVSALKDFARPLLATSTDGVGTKVAIAQAVDKHDTIGQDLVGMVVDDIVVVGAKPLFMTDYIACGKVVPSRIADIVAGIARACAETGTALVGGETAEHPGLLGPDDYDVAGAAVGAVEADAVLGADRVRDGDVVVALASSGLHSNGFSLVRHILSKRGIGFTDRSDEFGGVVGEVLLEPTRLYTSPLLRILGDPATGGRGARAEPRHRGRHRRQPRPRAPARFVGRGRPFDLVAPAGVPRAQRPRPVRLSSPAREPGISASGMFAVVEAAAADAVAAALTADGIPSWTVGTVSTSVHDLDGFEQGAKGVDGGAVRLVGSYA